MKKFNKRMVEGAVGVSVLGVFDEAVDSSDMGSLGQASKTTAKAGLVKKMFGGWF